MKFSIHREIETQYDIGDAFIDIEAFDDSTDYRNLLYVITDAFATLNTKDLNFGVTYVANRYYVYRQKPNGTFTEIKFSEAELIRRIKDGKIIPLKGSLLNSIYSFAGFKS